MGRECRTPRQKASASGVGRQSVRVRVADGLYVRIDYGVEVEVAGEFLPHCLRIRPAGARLLVSRLGLLAQVIQVKVGGYLKMPVTVRFLDCELAKRGHHRKNDARRHPVLGNFVLDLGDRINPEKP